MIDKQFKRDATRILLIEYGTKIKGDPHFLHLDLEATYLFGAFISDLFFNRCKHIISPRYINYFLNCLIKRKMSSTDTD